MRIKKFKDVQLVKSIVNDDVQKPDDFFITTASYEERCLGSLKLMTEDYKSKYIYIIKYEGKENDENYKKMKSILKHHGEIITYDINPMFPLFQISNVVKDIIKNKRNNDINIKIDITTFIKWNFLVFLKMLYETKLLHNVTIYYTEPISYETNLFQPLSFGLKEIFPIPFFYGNYDFSKENLLIIFLGYEGHRALSLYEKIEPEECILLIADPPYWPEWKGIAEELNKSLINLLGEINLKKIDSRNPIKVCESLKSILSRTSYKKYNHLISPLGTKPQTLGLFYYFHKYNPENTILTYTAPLRYNALFYSKGIGRTWKLPIYT